jgi:hypothetical protein
LVVYYELDLKKEDRRTLVVTITFRSLMSVKLTALCMGTIGPLSCRNRTDLLHAMSNLNLTYFPETFQ